ncbi:MAG: FeoA family protein [Fibrobacterota bacterium]
MRRLHEVPRGARAVIAAVEGSPEIRSKMFEQGIRPGTEIEVFSARPGQAAIIFANGIRIMLDTKTSRELLLK